MLAESDDLSYRLRFCAGVVKSTVESATELPPYMPSSGKGFYASSRKNARKKIAPFIGANILSRGEQFVNSFFITNLK